MLVLIPPNVMAGDRENEIAEQGKKAWVLLECAEYSKAFQGQDFMIFYDNGLREGRVFFTNFFSKGYDRVSLVRRMPSEIYLSIKEVNTEFSLGYFYSQAESMAHAKMNTGLDHSSPAYFNNLADQAKKLYESNRCELFIQ